MVFPYASIYILALGGESAQIGFVNSLRPLAGLIVFPISGYIADLAGRVKLISFAGYFSAITYLLYIFAPSWEWIALGSLIQGFMVFQFPPTSAIIADSLSPENRGTGIATMNTVATFAAMFSPYLAGVMLSIYGDEFGMRILYGILMVIYLINATLYLRFLKETSKTSNNKISLSDLPSMLKDSYTSIPSILKRLPRTFKALTIVIITGFIANAVASPFWVVYVVDYIGLSSIEWGVILLIESALKCCLYIPAGMLVDRYGRTRSLVTSLLLYLVSISLFIFSTGFHEILLVRSIIALTNAFFVPACSALMADIVPRDIRGRVMSAIGRGSVMIGASGGGTGGPGMGFLTTIPVMIASITGGYLYTFNPVFPWFFVLVTIITSIIVTILYIEDPKKAEI
jgi:MFS family permease